MSKRLKMFNLYIIISIASTLNAFSLKESTQKTINFNPEIKAELRNQEAYKKYVDEKEGAYLPTLDFTTYYDKTVVKKETLNNTLKYNGWNAKLKLEQLIYNGGFSSSEVSELKATTKANKHRSHLNIETVILKSLNVYLGLVQYEELMQLSKGIILKNEENLITAHEKEEISGEILETYQVSSKLHFSQEKLLEQEDEYNKNSDSFKKFVGIEKPKNLCRPLINKKHIPFSLEETLKIAVMNSDEVLESIAKINVQKAKISQANSRFLPTLRLQLESSWDNDLILEGSGREDEYLARLNLSWNLFNGLKDYNITEREEKFLLESKADLDEITNSVVMKTKSSYFKFYNNLKRVDILKSYVEDNVNIVDVYKKEFDAGTRTFVDILNAESELYQANTSLVNREFSLFIDYYDLLFNLSSLSKIILTDNTQICSIKKKEKIIKKENLDNLDNELLDLLEEPSESKIIKPIEKNENILGKDEDDVLQEDNSLIEKDKVSIMKLSSDSYILNLSTIPANESVEAFARKYNLDINKIVSFTFGNKMQYKKVLYGNYLGYKNAKSELKKLPVKILSIKPYIDNAKKHQLLYSKYNK